MFLQEKLEYFINIRIVKVFMKTLNLHVDYIKFKPLKKALKSIEELPADEKEEKHVKEALVVLTAVENTDQDIKSSVKDLVKNVEDISKQLGTKKVVLYPYAHLSKNLGAPKIAQEILKKAQKELEKKDYEVARAPFGYYKEFELKVKGHPLSELSREIGNVSAKVQVVKASEDDEKFDPKQLLREVSKSRLETSKLKDNDHRILGMQMDLFSFSEVAPGMVFWHNNGLIIYNELIKFWRELHKKEGYQEIRTPEIMDAKLWKISGHWDLYKENNFKTSYDGRTFLVKPMNCPGGMLVYKSSPKSYKELPLRVGELGTVHRVELSGTLAGLFRLIQFTQDDAHIFCTEKQLQHEIEEVINLFKFMLDKFGFKYRFTLSTRSDKKKDKYLGGDKIWDLAEGAIKKAANKLKIKFDESPGEAKFYGPSFDVQIKDSLKREWQCSTIQLDMQLPERFGLEYTDEKNNKKRPIMLHRVVYGAIERFIGILLEHTNGRLPTWLAPLQVRVLNFTDRNMKSAEKFVNNLKKEIPGIRVDFDFSQRGMPAKVKEAELARIPYILTIGDREEKENSVAVRKRGDRKLENMKVNNFVKNLKKEIGERE
jgi:threonyl-tRNA synthetase